MVTVSLYFDLCAAQCKVQFISVMIVVCSVVEPQRRETTVGGYDE